MAATCCAVGPTTVFSRRRIGPAIAREWNVMPFLSFSIVALTGNGVPADLCQRRASGEIHALHLRRVYERVSRRQPGSRFRRRGAHPGVLIAGAARVLRPLQRLREVDRFRHLEHADLGNEQFVYPAVAIVSLARSIWFAANGQPLSNPDRMMMKGFPAFPG